MKKQNDLRKLAVCGMMVALSFLLSFFTPFQFWPQGGSVTPGSMVPVIFAAVLLGPRWGVGSALVLSVLQLIAAASQIGGYGVSGVAMAGCIILDYLLAYTVLGLAGFARGGDTVRCVLGGGAVCLLRYLCHFVSGWLFFGMWAAEGYSALTWSLFYNMTYMLPETVITVLLLAALSPLCNILRRNFPFL